jgi:hypothetical protein
LSLLTVGPIERDNTALYGDILDRKLVRRRRRTLQSWVSADKEAVSVDIDGWEYALVERPEGPVRLKIHDHPVIGGYLVLLKKRSAGS